MAETALFLVLIIIVIFASLSSLLTFAWLFQVKEWRMDRLGEHLRHEGWIRSLFGRMRPLLLGIFLLHLLYERRLFLQEEMLGSVTAGGRFGMVILGWLVLFALLSIAQIIMHRQRRPRWTMKAILLTCIAFIISGALTLLSLGTVFLPFVLLLQPLWVVLAWAVLLPLDTFLKRRVLEKGKHARSAMKDVTVIGIAGSVGKTTTKELIKHLLQDLHPAATPAHVNTEMGVAQWMIAQEIRSKKQETNVFIIEMGAYRKGEIALLCSIAQPTIGVVTALGSDHLALFGSEQAIIDANAELIESLPANGHAFLDGTNDASKSLSTRAHCPVTVTSPAKEATDTDNGLTLIMDGSRFDVPLHGLHNAANVALAIAVAKHLDLEETRIRQLLKQFQPVAHTFNVHEERGVLLLDDTYNISPLSFHAALNWAAKQTKRPRVLLTSSLQETGTEEDRFLKELGTKAATCIERVVFTTDRGAETFAKTFGKQVETIGSDTSRVQPGSVLLCVGRMPLSTIQKLLPS